MLLSVLRVIRSLPVELRHMAFHHMRMTAGEERRREETVCRELGVFQTEGGLMLVTLKESADKRLLDLTHKGIIFSESLIASGLQMNFHAVLGLKVM